MSTTFDVEEMNERLMMTDLDAPSGEFERRSVHVRVPALLHQRRDHARGLDRSQHPAGHPTLRSAHPQRTLHLREPRRYPPPPPPPSMPILSSLKKKLIN